MHQMGDDQLKPLGDEQVEAVTGGYIYFAGGDDFYKRWEVIDGNGDVVARFGFFEEVVDYAESIGQNYFEITWEQLQRLRKTGSIW